MRSTQVLALALALAFAWLYGATFSALGNEWLSSADSSYGVVLAAVALLVAWNRRSVFAARSDPRSAPAAGLALLLFGIAMYLVGLFGADVFLTRVSLPVLAGGAMLFLAGPAATRVMAAPLVFLLLSIPPPTLIVNAITAPLQLVASRIAEASLMTIGVPVFREGNLLQLPSTTLEVAEACSGLRSLVSLGAVAVMLAWATEHRLLPRAAMVAAAVPIAVVANGFRVALTAVATEIWGPGVATGSWHTFTGWLTFVGSLALLMLLRRAFHATGRTRAVQIPAVHA